MANTIYVRQGATGTGDGSSEANAFTTIQAAINAAAAGDTVSVGAGTFTENITVGVGLTGLTILGANAGLAGSGTRVAETNIVGTAMVRGAGTNIDGVEFSLTAAQALVGQATPLSLRAADISVSNSLFSGPSVDQAQTNRPFIASGVATDLEFTSNKVTNWSGGGYLNRGGTGTVTSNVFDNNGNHLNVDATSFTLSGNAFTRAVGAPVAFGLYGSADLSVLVAAGNTFDAPTIRDLSITPLASNESVTGSSFDDVFRGSTTFSQFSFFGAGGNDTMLASAGADTFSGGTGNDVLEGTAALLNGDTFIFGDYGDSILVDAASNLRATFTNGQILIDGDGDGTADAIVTLQNAVAATIGVSANSIVFITPPEPPAPPTGPTTTPNDQGGNDITASDPSQITSSQGTSGVDNVTYTGSGTVTLPENIENITLTGTADSSVVGNALGNVETGNAGSNTLVAAEGDDTAAGGAGADAVYGNQGADFAYGNQGSDVLFGGQGNDIAFGGSGADLVYGNAGADAVYGNLGADAALGGRGADSLSGGRGADVLSGNAGADALSGNAGTDIVYGNQGADMLSGGDGNDLLFGGQGGDGLAGGVGNDTLAGGQGADLYSFGSNSGADLVLGFSLSEGDKLDLGGQTYTSADDGQGGTVLTLPDGGIVNLAGVAPSSLTPAAFA